MTKTKHLEQKHKQLSRKYKEIEHNIFYYKDYVQNCKGKCYTPGELIKQRNALFDEISDVTRELRRR